MIDIEWYVYYHDSNAQKIIRWNIFNHGSFTEKVKKLLKDNLSRDEFEDGLKKYLMYYMWSKCEYEIILSPWTGRADDIKIDVYDQIMMNWNSFVDYVWSLKEIKKEQNKMSKSISKEMLYEEFFDEVYESTEYSEDGESFKYSSFIDGLCSMTHRLLDKLGENEDKNSK